MKAIIIFWGIVSMLSIKACAQIQGDVTDTNEKGISNAMIIAIDSVRKTADTVKTDARGFYEFKKLNPGKYKIETKAKDFKTVFFENIVVREGDIGTVKGEEDLYRGQRLDIILSPAKLR
jgi:hypothetical protein